MHHLPSSIGHHAIVPAPVTRFPEPSAGAISGQLGERTVTATQVGTAIPAGTGALACQILPSLEPTNAPMAPPPWFEGLIPAPKEDLADPLQTDAWLKGTSKAMPLDEVTYNREVKRRREYQAENRDEDYTFSPFMTLLDNMHRLTVHFLDNRQFETDLAEDEKRAFVAIKGAIEAMQALNAPYKRTVWLAVLLSTVQEIVTVRHVIDDLRGEHPQLWKKERLKEFHFYACGAPGQERRDILKCREMSLDRLLACRWAGLNPEGVLDENTQFFDGSYLFDRRLPALLDNPEVFLCPSFEALDPLDFCHFGHLPIYPLGMMTRHALNADGEMCLPLNFFQHDVLHANIIQAGLDPDSHKCLQLSSGRDLFRSRVLDHLPAALRQPGIERAMTLIVFLLFHEENPRWAAERMDAPNAVPLLAKVNWARRVRRFDYPADYQRISDAQAFIACTFAHWMYHQPRQDAASPCHAASLATRFVEEQLPVLVLQWCFFEVNRQQIEAWLFSQQEQWRLPKDGSLVHAYRTQSDWTRLRFSCGRIIFREDWNALCEGPVDDTDVAYMALLQDAADRDRLPQALVPGALFLA